MRKMKDVLVSLTDDHVVLSWLAHRLRTARDGFSRSLLFNELAKALGGHISVMEYVVLPAMSRCGWHGVDSQVLVEHMVLKRHLADVLTLERGSAQFQAEVQDLCNQVEAQADREQLELLPALRECLGKGERAMLASEVESRLGAYLGELRAPGEHKDVDPPTAEELLQEAKVVLASLPNTPQRH
jgi:hypothetical protein